ncbi:efflux RND transporter periplasmic adaptor subunit, partial [Klebsiella pneumoniae]
MLAPFSGRILSISSTITNTVSANSTIIEMADLSQIQVQTTIGQQDVVSVKAGQSAAITFDARPGETFTGKLDRV